MIELATLNDMNAYREHLLRHTKESGRDGDIIFAPFDEPWDLSLEELQKAKADTWSRAITTQGWERVWLLKGNEKDAENVYGDLKLDHYPVMKTNLHRATLGMGIEKSYRGKGYGKAMIEAALAWAKQQASLDWVELFVFSHNIPAIQLYKKLGFLDVGTTPDYFRVHGQSIDDMKMILRLR